jgi:hypothetical protein
MSQAYSFNKNKFILKSAEVEEKKNDELDMSDLNFPALSSNRSSSSIGSTCWGDKNKMGVIKDAPSSKPVIPKKDIPPLFPTIKRLQTVEYVDEIDDMDYDNDL